MPAEFAATVRPHLETQLESGETLRGVIAATHQKTFSGTLHALGVTDRRLILQALDRHAQPKGEPKTIIREALASADADGIGAGWWRAGSGLVGAALTVTLRTRDGEKLKLMMMEGTGLLGSLGGGEAQREGVAALAEWMREQGG